MEAQSGQQPPQPAPAVGLERYRLPIIGALAVAGIIVLFFWAIWAQSSIGDGVDQSGTPVGWDFRAFHSAATMLSEGAGEFMYDQPWPPALDGPPFVNPPFSAFFFLPFVPLGVVPAWVVWSLLSLVALGVGFRALGVRSWPAATAAALLTVPVFFALRLGQTSLIVFMLMSLAYAALRSERLRAGGALLGLVVFKPQLLIGFVFWWASRFRRWRSAIVGGFAAGGALIAVSLILMPYVWVEFVEVIGTLPDLYAFGDSPYYEFAVWNVIVRDVSTSPAFISWLSLILTVAGGIGLVWFVRRVRDDLPMAYAGAVVVPLIASAHMVVHDWTLLLICGVLLWQRLPEERAALTAMGLALLYTTILSPFLVLYQLEAFGFALNLAPVVLIVCTIYGAGLAIRSVDRESKVVAAP